MTEQLTKQEIERREILKRASKRAVDSWPSQTHVHADVDNYGSFFNDDDSGDWDDD
jgi:hypothetical protein